MGAQHACELILGGQRSGKSAGPRCWPRVAGCIAQRHRAYSSPRQPWDDEMRERIARHQRDRAQRVPGMVTVEEPWHLAGAIAQHSRGEYVGGGGLPDAVADEPA
jgi:adenosylcobinamide kinase/adenosylcobinamide-phosphate guanylyltransferase